MARTRPRVVSCHFRAGVIRVKALFEHAAADLGVVLDIETLAAVGQKNRCV
jgi:hypothetical protein